jgi:hypothetical protein
MALNKTDFQRNNSVKNSHINSEKINSECWYNLKTSRLAQFLSILQKEGLENKLRGI